MKQLTNYRRTVQYLTKIYNLANEEFFNGELPEVTLTVQENIGTYGHISVSNTWFTVDGKGMRELNISAQHLTRPIEAVTATILHEMSHLYNMEHGIKDVSANGFYHNKNFKKTAEEMAGLIISKDQRYGWTITEPGERVLDFCITHELEDIQIGKGIDLSGFFGGGTAGTTTTVIKPKKPTKSNSIKWICPHCGMIIRSTRDNINVICGDCNEQFVKA